MNPRVQRYLTRLGNAFRDAYEGKISLDMLYAWGEAINFRLAADVDEGRVSEDDEGVDLLWRSTGKTYQLHDQFTQNYISKNPEKLEKRAKMLLGEVEPKFTFGPDI